MVGDRHKGQRKCVRRKYVGDRLGVLVGQDTKDDVFRPVIGEKRRERTRRFDIVRSIEPGLRRSGERPSGQFLEAGRPSCRARVER